MKKNHCELISGVCKIWKSKFLRKMRIVTLLLLISITQTFALDAYAQNKRLNLNVKNEAIVNILEKIEDQSKFYFMFDASRINVDQRKSVDCENQLITSILDQLFENTGIIYSINDRQVLLTTEKSDAEQQKPVSGRVTDSLNQPLPGVTVVVKGTTHGTITDGDGNYSLPKVPGDATLVFSFVGMKTQEISVSGKTSINVVMEEEAIGIEEVVAIGYGTMKKSDLTGSVISANIEAFQEAPNVNIMQSLQGSVPGIQIGQVDHSGEEPSIKIRGTNTLSGNKSPLIIVDDIIYSGRIGDLNPSDIKSVEVLKDASSKAIYGSQAANGVILISTKMGKITRKPVFNYSGSVSFQAPTVKARLLNREENLEIE